MGYIGNQTSNSFTSMDKQSITGNGTTGPYTLTHAVANEQEIEVFVNNVRQEPGVAYTVSGNAMTMTCNVAASDDFYVVFQGKAIQTTVPGDDTITAAMIKDGVVTSAKVDSTVLTSASTLLSSNLSGALPALDGSALTGISGGLLNTACAFGAYHNTTQSFGQAQQTDLLFNTERWDVGNDYDPSTSRFTVPINGIYLFHLRYRREGNYSGTDIGEFHVNNTQTHRIFEETNLNNSYSYPQHFETSWTWYLSQGNICNIEFYTNASSSVISGYADPKYANNWTGCLIQEV